MEQSDWGLLNHQKENVEETAHSPQLSLISHELLNDRVTTFHAVKATAVDRVL